jgi:hypothetical protein
LPDDPRLEKEPGPRSTVTLAIVGRRSIKDRPSPLKIERFAAGLLTPKNKVDKSIDNRGNT